MNIRKCSVYVFRPANGRRTWISALVSLAAMLLCYSSTAVAQSAKDQIVMNGNTIDLHGEPTIDTLPIFDPITSTTTYRYVRSARPSHVNGKKVKMADARTGNKVESSIVDRVKKSVLRTPDGELTIVLKDIVAGPRQTVAYYDFYDARFIGKDGVPRSVDFEQKIDSAIHYAVKKYCPNSNDYLLLDANLSHYNFRVESGKVTLLSR